MNAPYENFDEYIYKSIRVLEQIEKDKYKLQRTDNKLNDQVFKNNSQPFIDQDLNEECVNYNENPTLFGTISMLKNLYKLYENEKIPNADDIKTFVCGLTAYINDRRFLGKSDRCTNVRDCFLLLREAITNREVLLEQLKTDIFLSETVFNDTTIEYLSKGANSSADKIKITNNGNELYLIEKSNLRNTNLHRDMMREFIIGVHLLFYISDVLPNFTMSYGIYGCNAPIALKDATVSYKFKDYDSKAPFYNRLSDLISKYYNMYTNIDESHNDDKYVANIDQNEFKYYLLTDYSKGFSLGGYLELYGDNPNVVVDIMFQAVRALVYAYNKIGYVHNDFHTKNSIVTELTDSIYIQDPLFNLTKKYNCHKTKIILKIIDYGYSSIRDYPRYQSNIYSDENTTVHNDILKFGLGLAQTLLKYKHYNSLAYVIAFILAYYFDDLRKYTLKNFIEDESLCILVIETYNEILTNNPDDSFVAYKYNPQNVLSKYGVDTNRNNPVTDIYMYMIEVYKKNEKKFKILYNNCDVNFYQDRNLEFMGLINKTFSSMDIGKIKNELSTLQMFFKQTNNELKSSANPKSQFLKYKNYNHLLIESLNSYIALVRKYTYIQIYEPQVDYIFNFENINRYIKEIFEIIMDVFSIDFSSAIPMDNEILDQYHSTLKILYNLNQISYI